MKQLSFALSASIAAALVGTPSLLLAQPTAATNALAGINTSESARITKVVSNSNLATLAKTHLAFVPKAASGTPMADTDNLRHLQLVLKPSVTRQAAMEAFIAAQHNPKSASFHQWLTPAQFGDAFGVVDSDIAAITAWLTAQGFTVNSVYPNKTQIDFSGTVGQVNHAFHTQEGIYAVGGAKHRANASDISVPSALKDVVAGVMGLNDFHPNALHKKSQVAQWDASKKGFVLQNASAKTAANSKGDAISYGGGVRGLAPNDLATMYDVKPLRANGVTGTGVTIAVVEDDVMNAADWTNFTQVFNLAQYGGTFSQINPQATNGSNCVAPFGFGEDDPETLLDAEWSTAIAPGANIEVAVCADADLSGNPVTDNFFGGVFVAASNLINGDSRPDIISASYGYGEYFTDAASKLAIDQMWAQADAEGISVFVSAGDSGSNPSFNGSVINNEYGNTAVDANALATSPHVTAVGGTDTADILDGTTSQYFAPVPSVVGGSALSYVPEIPWNASCGNGVAAKALGFSGAPALCARDLAFDPDGMYFTSEAGSGGPSSVDAKPSWQSQVFNAAKDSSRDVPDVALFAGSYGGHTWVITCSFFRPCSTNFATQVELSGGTSLASPMFAGIQALMDQGLAARGVAKDQGNAAPTLYALAANEYGAATGSTPSSLATCSADNGATGTANCVFHNVTRGSISTQCESLPLDPIPNCFHYGWVLGNGASVGLTTSDAAPTSYGVSNKAYGAQPGWSFASGLGSVDARNLLIAWRAFAAASAASVSSGAK